MCLPGKRGGGGGGGGGAGGSVHDGDLRLGALYGWFKPVANCQQLCLDASSPVALSCHLWYPTCDLCTITH